MKLYIISKASTLNEGFVESLQPNDIIVYTDHSVYFKLRSTFAKNIISFDEILSKEELAEVDKFNYKTKKIWYRTREGVDLSLWQDISLGEISEFSVGILLNTPIKWLFTLGKLLSKNRIDSLLTDYDASLIESEVINIFCRKNGLEKRYLMNNERNLFSLKMFNRKGTLSNIQAWSFAIIRQIKKILRTKMKPRKSGLPSIGLWPYSSPLINYDGEIVDLFRIEKGLSSPFERIYYSRLGQSRYLTKVKEAVTLETKIFDQDYGDDLEAMIFKHIDDKWPGYMGDYISQRRLFANKKMKLLIVLSDEPDEAKIAISAAHSLGIKSLVIQHGYFLTLDNLDDLQRADYRLVHNEYIARELVKRGVNNEKIIVTGMLFANESRIVSRVAGEQKPMILICTCPQLFQSSIVGQTHSGKYLEIALEACKGLKQFELLIKLHPCESLDYYERLIKAAFGEYKNIKLCHNNKIKELIAGSSLVVSPMSTVIFETMVQEKPVVCLNIIEAYQIPPFDGKSDVLTVNNVSALKDSIFELLNGTSRVKEYPFLSKYIGDVNVPSIKKMTEAMTRLKVMDVLVSNGRCQ